LLAFQARLHRIKAHSRVLWLDQEPLRQGLVVGRRGERAFFQILARFVEHADHDLSPCDSLAFHFGRDRDGGGFEIRLSHRDAGDR
jgi:hypothetical protein